jgi:DNA-binding phage protein
LRAEGDPEFATVMRVVKALGLQFSISPIRQDDAA